MTTNCIDSELRTPIVTACRGCCCGTERAYPGVDHVAQLDMLRDELAGHARLRVTGCLGPCERGNVVVVSPSTLGRLLGGRPAWLGHVLEREAINDIGDWVRAGGPGIVQPPNTIELYRFRP